MQEPEILPIGAQHSAFALEHLSAGKASTPACHHSFQVFSVNEGSPGPALKMLFTLAEVFKPALIEETEPALGVRTVQKRRGRVDDAPQ